MVFVRIMALWRWKSDDFPRLYENKPEMAAWKRTYVFVTSRAASLFVYGFLNVINFLANRLVCSMDENLDSRFRNVQIQPYHFEQPIPGNDYIDYSNNYPTQRVNKMAFNNEGIGQVDW